MATNERPMFVQRFTFISPRAIAAALVALISAGFYFWYLVSLQDRLRTIVSEAERKQAHARQQVSNLTLDHSSLEAVAGLLTKISVDDRSNLEPTLQETVKFSQSTDSALDKVAEELEVAHSAEKSAFIWELRSAINRTSTSMTTLNALQRDIDATRARNAETLAGLSDALREETAVLHEEIQAFYFTIAAVLKELESPKNTLAKGTSEASAIHEDAIQLARLAALVYSPQSLVKKRTDLATEDRSLAEIAHDVVVLPNARKAVANARIAGRSTPAPRIALSRKGAAWRVSAPGLNVREGPTGKAPVVCALSHNETVTVVANAGDWWNVEARCGEGWVAARHLVR